MSLPEPQSITFSSLFAEIEHGTIKIPQFQRDFVWSKSDSAKLLDSIVKGYPIGTFILWKTNERLRSIRNLGGLTLPDTPKGDAVKYVLDGQQRLTSLFVTLKGLSINREDRTDDFSRVWVDLAVDEEQEIILIDIEGRDSKEIIQLKDLLLGDFAYLASFQPEFQQKIRTYKNRVESYQFSTILMKDSTIDVATEVFERLNVGGKRLSVFEIMVAKTYDPETNFDLAEKYKALISNLQAVDYGTLSSTTILQAVSVLLRKDCRKKEILNLRSMTLSRFGPRQLRRSRIRSIISEITTAFPSLGCFLIRRWSFRSPISFIDIRTSQPVTDRSFFMISSGGSRSVAVTRSLSRTGLLRTSIGSTVS